MSTLPAEATASAPPTSTLVHSWPERLLLALVAAVGVWIASSIQDQARTSIATRETLAEVKATMLAMQESNRTWQASVEARISRLESTR